MELIQFNKDMKGIIDIGYIIGGIGIGVYSIVWVIRIIKGINKNDE